MKRDTGFTIIELLIALAIIGVIAGIAIPNLMAMMDRGRQKRTMADIRSVATAAEEYSIDNSFYPASAEASIASSSLPGSLVPIYTRTVPSTDGWVFPLRYSSDTSIYTIGSLGKDGGLGGSLTLDGTGGGTSDYDCDIIFSGGVFVQWPEGHQTD